MYHLRPPQPLCPLGWHGVPTVHCTRAPIAKCEATVLRGSLLAYWRLGRGGPMYTRTSGKVYPSWHHASIVDSAYGPCHMPLPSRNSSCRPFCTAACGAGCAVACGAGCTTVMRCICCGPAESFAAPLTWAGARELP